MSNKKLADLVHEMENYLECWKQFNQFVTLAHNKKFGPEDENQFLEVKSVIAQELELILSAVEIPSLSKEEIHTLIGSASSLRYLSEMNEMSIRNLENQWHKIYISLHSILGQIKVRQQAEDSKSMFASIFGKKDK